MKVCTKCKNIKDLEHFSSDSSKKDGKHPNCKECHYLQMSSYKKQNRKIDPNKYKHRKLKERYGISLKEYEKLLEKQKHKCLICEKHKSKFNIALAVDHCHKTNKIRGLLCFNCNTKVGHVETNPEIYLKINSYLNEE